MPRLISTHGTGVVKVALFDGWESGLPPACATADTWYVMPGCRPGMAQAAGPPAITTQGGTPGTQVAVAASHTVRL